MNIVRTALISLIVAAFAVTVFYGCWAWWAFIAACFGWGAWATYGAVQLYALGGYAATLLSWGALYLTEGYARNKAATRASAGTVHKPYGDNDIEGEFRAC